MVDMKMGPVPPFLPPYEELSRYEYWPSYYDTTPTRAGNSRHMPASSRGGNTAAPPAAASRRPARTTAAAPTDSANSTTTAPSSRGAQFTIIANVPYDTVRQDLVSEFRKFGRVELAMVVCDEASRHPHKEWTSTAGYAFVRFSKRSEAAAAIQAATMGLITIRGTRVRADWARKDSYAKRGRVSPAQGAPALNPLGIPDGITLLQDSLNRAAARNQWSMYSTAANTMDQKDWTPPIVPKAVDVDPSNEQVLQVLEDAIVQALELIQPASKNQNKKPDCYAEEDNSVAIAEELASALSPTSRGLLTIALSDVAARDAFTDVSPVARLSTTNSAACQHFNSPEELLHQTLATLAPQTARKSIQPPAGALGGSTASDFSSLSEIEDIACSESSL